MSDETKIKERRMVRDYVAALRALEQAEKAYSEAVVAHTKAGAAVDAATKALGSLVGRNLSARNFKVDESTVLRVMYITATDRVDVTLLKIED